MLSIIGSFFLSLAAGNATFSIWVKGKKFFVNLENNGKAQGPNLRAIPQLANAAMGAALSGVTSATVRIGANNWTVTVTPA